MVCGSRKAPTRVQVRGRDSSASAEFTGCAFTRLTFGLGYDTLRLLMDSRELTPTERGLLEFMLSNMQPEAVQLLPQLEGARVLLDEGYDPARRLGFELRPDVVPVDLPDGPIGRRAGVFGPGGEILGEVFLYVWNGRLQVLQQAFYTDGPRPTAMPDASSIRIEPDPPITYAE